MGRFEDLIEQAEGGDTDALQTLREEFSGSALREQAEANAQFRKKYEENLPVVRKARLDDLAARLDEDLREVGLDIGDFGDFDPDDLTLEKVQDVAKAKAESTQAAKLQSAQDAGFDSVEEYEEALQAVKEQRQKRKTGMEEVAGGVAGSGGEPGGEPEPETPYDHGRAAFEAAKAEGYADDHAMAESINAILTAQSPAEGES